jgi:hypothetical protein
MNGLMLKVASTYFGGWESGQLTADSGQYAGDDRWQLVAASGQYSGG